MENIITIHEKCSIEASHAFKNFMCLIENELNARARKTPNLYCNCKGQDLEIIAESVMKEVSPSTPFRADQIHLISGQCFPDIIAAGFYGVEVKSTKENHWTSTGSSIVESTRNKTVENIYMLFGKLGGKPAEFKCRPYEDCLSDIAVTHSPRYLINMELSKEQTIFSKMNTTYDTLRISPDSIEQVRAYYRQKAKAANRKEMPWWLGQQDEAVKMNVRLWNDREYRGVYSEENRILKAKMLILFPEILKSDYRNVALWLCVKYSIVLYNARDLFSASGQYTKLNGDKLSYPLPHVIGEILSLASVIKYLLANYQMIESELLEYRPELLRSDRYNIWLRQITIDIQQLRTKIENPGRRICELGGIPFDEWFDKECILS